MISQPCLWLEKFSNSNYSRQSIVLKIIHFIAHSFVSEQIFFVYLKYNRVYILFENYKQKKVLTFEQMKKYNNEEPRKTYFHFHKLNFYPHHRLGNKKKLNNTHQQSPILTSINVYYTSVYNVRTKTFHWTRKGNYECKKSVWTEFSVYTKVPNKYYNNVRGKKTFTGVERSRKKKK